MLPFIEVSHLSSSSSFYSTVTQPLGLRYIYAADPAFSLPGSQSITYGLATSPPIPVFELRQIRDRPLKLSRVVFSADSPGVVGRFQTLVQGLNVADGRVVLTGDRSLLCQSPELESSLGRGNTEVEAGGSRGASVDWRLSMRVAEKDPDGNVMEVVYLPPPGYPESYSGTTTRKTNSSTGEISRIMTWNYDVAASDPAPHASLCRLAPGSSSLASPMRPGRFPDDDMAPVLRRTVTTTSTSVYEEPLVSPRQNSSGLTTGTLVGTLLGVAAASAAIGAGVAYSAMRHERGRSELEPPTFQRRTTYPEPQLGAGSRYTEYGPAERDRLSISDRRPPPTLLTRYPYSQGPRDAESVYDDSRSQRSSRCKSRGAASIRTRSEASSARKPLLLTDADHRSYVSMGSRHSARTSEMDDMVAGEHRSQADSRLTAHTSSRSKYYAPGSAAPSLRRSSTYDDADRASYVSTRSHRTASTVRPLQPTVQTELTTPTSTPTLSLVSRPKAASRVSGATIKTSSPSATARRPDSYVSAREVPVARGRAASRAVSCVSARHLALPANGAGSSKVGYEEKEEEEDDLCSIAPSESISCVGSRQSARLYR